MNYVSVDLRLKPVKPFNDIFIALLGEIGYESFEEDSGGLKAYINEGDFSEAQLQEVLAQVEGCEVTQDIKRIEQVNWNAEWEKDYHPVQISEDCVIRALFHEPMPQYRYELLVQPQMSFGTGHHPTTVLMLQHLLEMEVSGLSVLDVGTGTGVLAILAEKMGAHTIQATDIEDYIVENARENARHNACVNIRVDNAMLAEIEQDSYGIILANINLNALLAELENISSMSSPGAQVLMSGFYDADAEQLIAQASSCGLRYMHKKTQDNWAALRFEKSDGH